MHNLTAKILLGLFAGIVVGLLLGEYARWLAWIGTVFVGLLQMSVLPFVFFSLIANLGRLDRQQGRLLAVAGLKILMLLWGIGLLLILLFSQAFPEWQSGSFFSSSLVEPPPQVDWFALFIPSNPFASLADNMVPAVVLFALLLGTALMTIKSKGKLLNLLDTLTESLSVINRRIIALSPIGTFGIVANAVGTQPLADLGLMQGYLLVASASTFLLVFVLLPLLVSALTPIPARQLLSASKEALITAFVVGSTFVVIPMIVESARKLLQQQQSLETDGSEQPSPEFVIPLAYPFADLGRVMALLFVPFGAWFYGITPSLTDWLAFLATAIPASFAKVTSTIPVMLEIFRVPSDLYQLFLAVGVYAGRLGDLLQTIHLLSFTLLSSCLLNGTFKLRAKALLVALGVSGLIALLSIGAIRSYLDLSFKERYAREDLVTQRQLLMPQVEASLHHQRVIAEPAAVNISRIEQIRQRGVLRVGYDADELPFTYLNAANQLVGFDVDMAHQLAASLGVKLAFIPFEHRTLIEQLQSNEFEIAMAGLEGTVKRATTSTLADSYLDVTMALVVADHRKDRFADLKPLQLDRDLRLAVVEDGFFEENLPRYFPNAQIIRLSTEREFFEPESAPADALLTSAEIGSAWTLLHPRFAVANPFEGKVRLPLYYITVKDIEFEEFLEVWIELKQKDGTLDRLYDYWILGQSEPESRWSLIDEIKRRW